jgi:hypothetical protein
LIAVRNSGSPKQTSWQLEAARPHTEHDARVIALEDAI